VNLKILRYPAPEKFITFINFIIIRSLVHDPRT